MSPVYLCRGRISIFLFVGKTHALGASSLLFSVCEDTSLDGVHGKFLSVSAFFEIAAFALLPYDYDRGSCSVFLQSFVSSTSDDWDYCDIHFPFKSITEGYVMDSYSNLKAERCRR